MPLCTSTVLNSACFDMRSFSRIVSHLYLGCGLASLISNSIGVAHNPDLYDTTIGIDLGTTYSCVAVHRGGRVEVIVNDEGSRITPLWVTFGENDRRRVTMSGHVWGDANFTIQSWQCCKALIPCDAQSNRFRYQTVYWT